MEAYLAVGTDAVIEPNAARDGGGAKQVYPAMEARAAVRAAAVMEASGFPW